MAVLGKRKASEQAISHEEAQEIFRRHFEAQFQPLPDVEPEAVPPSTAHADDTENDEEESEWGGLSDDAEDDDEDADDENQSEHITLMVVDHSSASIPTTTMSKRELKIFMSSRPPDSSSAPKTVVNNSTAPDASSSLPEDAPSLLAQDLELRRLLAESHLFSRAVNHSPFASTTASEPKAFNAGRIRRKATDLRVQALGSSASILTQDRIPMNIRKGMNAAAAGRETKRRREAKENGVILERAASKKKTRDRRKDPMMDGPGVGRLRGAELRLSSKDVRGIEGSRDTFGRRGKR
ncbi:hypothetical protein S7711_05979 [Stachybotrys chartarum IBT 7711]|uniref:Protein FAF1 n=1 Tax=Stachybotrys chartarum (strain CBS 109288 / IBT 7711) TaxID=1280523 RepID=A0A084B2Q9_STACB|nr:hypothetical protein S7711_05979 [Stachybotrys chartarum IBT 7711]KFA50434.1 hypothetical protein S40293_08965 [Stachybotrys chartarum IBT 40293]